MRKNRKEKGFGDAPEVVAETIRLAAEVGLVGCTIEDATGNQDHPLYDVRLAVERIAAAAQAARALQFPFILTARAHNLLYAAPRLDDTIRRLHAFEEAALVDDVAARVRVLLERFTLLPVHLRRDDDMHGDVVVAVLRAAHAWHPEAAQA